MTILYLVRHAESAPDDNLPEPFWPLSASGRRQAVALAPALERLGIEHVYSSPYPRAIDTLRPFADQAGLDIRLEHGLRERKLTDAARADWLSILERAWTDFDFSLPACETSRQAQQRMLEACRRIAGRHPDCTIAASSHGNAIGLLLNSLDGSFGFQEWKKIRNPDLVKLTWESGDLRWDRSFLFGAGATGETPPID